MAEAVVNVVVEQLVSAAADWLRNEISLLKGVKAKLDNMRSKMQIIQTVVEDAENQSVKKEIVKLWLRKLQGVSYDMDDVLDEWSTRVHILEREEAEGNTSSSSPTTGKFSCFSLKKLNCFSSAKQLPWRRGIALRIKDINERIDSVFLEMKDLKFASKAVGNDELNSIINRNDIARTTTSFIDESKVYGREKDKKFLLSKVLSINTEQEKGLQVISIVGAGGLGKITLAQMVYNDKEVEQKFGGKRIWVCVSNPFDEFKVARHILEGLKEDHNKMISLQALHDSIKESLSEHKFLLVLDDVWNEDFEKWDKLSKCLNSGDPNSRILVTTRKVKVATIIGTIPSNILKLQHISDSDCWLLMSEIAFQGRTNTDSELEDIGKVIAKKCKGLPIAAKTLGAMLISKNYVDEWKQLLNSEIWQLEQVEVELFPHIFLSYQELPPVLKRCFLILAIFPKDTKLEVERVIAIWTAHGFLNPRTKNDDMVKTGQKYIKFLVSRALLEEKYYRISMHDIMHDFALHLSAGELISIEVLNKIENDNALESTSEKSSCLKSTTTRHFYIDGNIDPTSIDFHVAKLHTCIMRNVDANVTLDLVKRLKMVRTLYLVRCDLKHVPQNIKDLIHLRSLDLSYNPLVGLPETIGGLFNLQHLFLKIYFDEFVLSTLPYSIGNLTNLILLYTPVFTKYLESLGRLISLQKLGPVYVGAGKNKLGLLKDLNQLRGLFEIGFTSEYGDEDDAKKAAIEKKKHITHLRLNFNNHEITDGVIAALQPHENIQQLTIDDLPRRCVLLPCWITSLHHLTKLGMTGAPNVMTLPPLGELQSLKELYISEFDALKMIGREFMGMGNKPNNKCSAFPKLEKLEFFGCDELTRWEDLKREEEDSINVMPNLQSLQIGDCEKLVELPWRLLRQATSLQRIMIEGLPSLEIIGKEFSGIDDHNNIDHFVAFPSLLELDIIECGLLQWEDLKPEDEGKVIVMPKLQQLRIRNCEKLQLLPSRLLSGAASLKVYVDFEQCYLHPSIKSENESAEF